MPEVDAARLLAGVEAIAFDMDGTLIDSEIVAERVVHELLRERGISPAGLDGAALHGVSWLGIEALLAERFAALAGQALADELLRRFDRCLVDSFPPPVPGAIEALRAAAAAVPAAIVTSSNRASLTLMLDHFGLHATVAATICAEDCTRTKPDPQPYLLAAQALGCTPERLVVFEDSVAGLRSARAAGARTVAITRGDRALATRLHELADASIVDYTGLPLGCFAAAVRRGAP